jgi:peptide/nickel transport system substrate-binding protein
MTNGPGFNPNDPMDPGSFTRRTGLKVAGAGLLIAGAGSVLAACGGDASTTSTPSAGGTTAAAAGTPKKGGSLNLGAQGGSDNDTLDAQQLLTNCDFARGYALYEGLTRVDNASGKVVMLLAESMEPNKDATQWTVRLKPNITTHDGKPFGAKDVIYSFNRLIKNKYPGAINLGPINMDKTKALDETTVKVVFDKPYGIFPQSQVKLDNFLVPVGYDPKKPVGTGPFKLDSFTPGQASTMSRHDGYWQTGKPYLDKLIITNIADETAQVNALQSGQVDAIDYLSSTSLNAVKGAGGQVNVSKTGGWGPFDLQMDVKPFSDNRVRLALKLVIDRPQMNEQVFGGLGTIGNDVFSPFDEDYDKSIPQRVQDIDQAKSLLKAAGYPSLNLNLITTANAPGQVQAAQVFATQAKAAGVNVKITNQTPTDYFAKSYNKVPFTQDFWPYMPFLMTAAQATAGKNAPFNLTRQNIPAYNKAYETATQTIDPAVRKEAAQAMMKIDHDEGGLIIPYFFPVIDGLATKVKGVVPSVSGIAMGQFDWANIWVTG